MSICEKCGQTIEYPNYIISHHKGIFNGTTFYECAFCDLEFKIEQYQEFGEAIKSVDWHHRQLSQINKMTQELRGKI